MTRRSFRLLIVFGFCAAPLAYPNEPDVRRLISELSNKNSAVRDRARAALSRIGRPVLPELRQAEVSDPETRRIVKNLIARIACPKWAVPVGTEVDHKLWLPRHVRHKSTQVEMVLVPGGRVVVGADPSDKDADLDYERPRRTVTIRPFYIGRFEVTAGEWLQVMGKLPSSENRGKRLPVVSVSWRDVQPFLKRTGLRLPSDDEWECACRAGTKGAHTERATVVHRAEGIQVVGSRSPNKLGIYDMIGNVWEWTTGKGPDIDKEGHQFRSLRGGGINCDSYWLRIAAAPTQRPCFRSVDVGFRVARFP